MIWILLAACAIAAGYQLLALLAAVHHRLRRDPPSLFLPPVSILKPVCGLDEGFAAAIESHARIDYPRFEIVFGAADPQDPAVVAIQRLAACFPGVSIRLVTGTQPAANRKVGVLMELAQAARHDILVVNDGDITVPSDYLRRVVAPLSDPGVGLVTCAYRARAASVPARWEALGIATDFGPSTLVAPWVGVREFGLGSTLAFRRGDLAAIGGFASIAPYLADDYQLARRIHALGRRIHLSPLVVETWLSGAAWSDVWRHQVRWARTIRVSRGGGHGYLGLPVTFATAWSLAAAACGAWAVALGLLALRLLAAVAGICALRDGRSALLLPLVPLRDLWGVAVWFAGLRGHSVHWRGHTLQLDAEGRIAARSEQPHLLS